MKLVILDRDNTLIRMPVGRRYLFGDDEILLADGAIPFLKALHERGLEVAIATNQQGVALPEYPDMTLASVERFHARLQAELHRRGAPEPRIYVCPHSAASRCPCRKPRPGLYVQAMQDFGVGSDQTAAIGDERRDLEAANAAGIRALFWLSPHHVAGTATSTSSLPGAKIVSSLADCLASLLT